MTSKKRVLMKKQIWKRFQMNKNIINPFLENANICFAHLSACPFPARLKS
jgi:hypothetical protein